MTTSTARKTFAAFTRTATDQIPDADLDAFWDTLQPATIDFMIGEWKGGEFATGHQANGFMKRLNWFGKTFHSAADAKPLMCLDADGNKFSNTGSHEGRGEPVARGVPRRGDRIHGLRTARRCTTTSRESMKTPSWAS